MAVGTYLGQALTNLQTSADKRANDIVAGGGGRFTYDNADQVGGGTGEALATDRTRLNQLGILRDRLNSPDMMQGINDQADTQKYASEVSAGEQARQATGRLRASLARRGLSGGSQDVQQTANVDVQLAAAKAQAKTQADEIRSAGITGLQDLEKSLTNQIMGLNDDGTGQTRLDQINTDSKAGEIQAQLNEQYRGLLSNSIAGVLNNTVTPAITTGFDYADRVNAQNDRQDTLDQYAGKTPTKRPASSWWGFN